MKKRTLITCSVILVVIIPIVFWLTKSGTSNKTKWPKLRIGYLPVAAELPLFVAIEQGYFEKEGIEFELVRFASSNELGNAATADKIDVLAGAASNVIFDIAKVSGKKHLVFAVNPYSNRPGYVTDHLIVRKNSGIKQLTDLNGKKIASFPGSVNRLFTYLILEKHGVSRTSYEYSELLPKDWEPSLQAGAIDAVSALEPNATQILKDGVGDSIFPGFYADLMPDVPLSAHWTAADYYTRADKKQIAALLTAYENAIQFCRDHQNEAKGYLVKYANVREDIVKDVNLNPWKKLGEIDSAQFQAYIDLLANNQAIQAKVTFIDFLLPDPRSR